MAFIMLMWYYNSLIYLLYLFQNDNDNVAFSKICFYSRSVCNRGGNQELAYIIYFIVQSHYHGFSP